jgi:Delta7-sterol 5-desaturase
MTDYLIGGKHWLSLFVIVWMRYVILASLAFLLYYVILKKLWQGRKIQKLFPRSGDYYREVAYSFLTAIIFTAIGYGVYLTPFVNLTHAYFNINEYPVWYLVLSVLMMIVVHDTYFYWTHRFMHYRGTFRILHRVHHLSTNPSPWAAMAFHPLEAVVEAGVIVIIPFLFPVHPLAIGIFLLFMMTYNVYGHLGYELYPKGFCKSFIGKWINTSVNHNQHHETMKGNYGLYFLFWDRLMGTIDKDYDSRFENATTHPR